MTFRDHVPQRSLPDFRGFLTMVKAEDPAGISGTQKRRDCSTPHSVHILNATTAAYASQLKQIACTQIPYEGASPDSALADAASLHVP